MCRSNHYFSISHLFWVKGSLTTWQDPTLLDLAKKKEGDHFTFNGTCSTINCPKGMIDIPTTFSERHFVYQYYHFPKVTTNASGFLFFFSSIDSESWIRFWLIYYSKGSHSPIVRCLRFGILAFSHILSKIEITCMKSE